jgi:hypothetical protein
LTNCKKYGIINTEIKERGKNQMKEFFELNKPYKFDVTDLTALIYVIAAILGVMGVNPTIPFLIGATISTAFCWQARRINLIILNVALFGLNLVNFIKMF